MTPENIQFPVAQPNIEQVLDEFLNDQRQRLKPTTVRKYESIIDLLKHSLDGYAYQGLSQTESEMFDVLYNLEGEAHREFVQIFGPEKIPENINEFLGYFMPRKVICGKETLKAAGTVVKKLGRWLVERGYVTEESSDEMVISGKEASSELPAAEELTEMLFDYADSHPVSEWTDEIEDQLTVVKVEPGKIHFEDPTSLRGKPIVLTLPKGITNKCREGWDIGMYLGKTKKGWRIIEVWQVYPM